MMHTQRAERVDYATTVQLLAVELGEPISGYTANLSESGMFVTVPHPLEVGTRVCCELPISGDRLLLNGQVRWVQEVAGHDACCPMMGVGIQFIELSAAAAMALRLFIAERKGSLYTVAVQFEGYDRPIRARAQVTAQGLQLWTALPFLRLRSPVNVSFEKAAQDARVGVLDQVLLSVEQGVPRLKIDVKLEQRDEPQQDSDPEFATERMAVLTPAPAVSGSIVELPRSAYSRAIAEEIAAPSVTIEPASDPGRAAAEEPLSEEQSYEELQTAVDHIGEPSWADHAVVEGAPEETLLVEPPPYDHFWKGTEQRRWRKWVWVAALAMAGLAIASLARPRLWSSVADGLWPARTIAESAKETANQLAVLEQGSAAASTNAERRAPAAAPAPPSRSTPARTIRAAAPTSGVSTGKTKAPPAAKTRELEVTRRGSTAMIEIPIAGSIEEATHYPLADPDGVAVNLPRATPGLAPGYYTVNEEGFKAVWIRSRMGGIQVRVFFVDASPAHEVAVERGRITVETRDEVTPVE